MSCFMRNATPVSTSCTEYSLAVKAYKDVSKTMQHITGIFLICCSNPRNFWFHIFFKKSSVGFV